MQWPLAWTIIICNKYLGCTTDKTFAACIRKLIYKNCTKNWLTVMKDKILTECEIVFNKSTIYNSFDVNCEQYHMEYEFYN